MPSFKKTLAELIPFQKVQLMYGTYDIIGDIILTKVPSELDEYEQEVGEALHRAHPKVTKVFRVIGKTEAIERNRQLKLLWSEPQKTRGESSVPPPNIGRTVYREQGCRFIVDVEKVFFTPRLSYERMRIAKQVKPGEVVATMFGGVGTYSIIIAKACPEVERVYSIDVNPFANELARENIIINRCSNKVISILGDADTVCSEQLRDMCSRIIMPLPEAASAFLGSAVLAMKTGKEGIINFYAEISGREIENEAQKVITEARSTILACSVNSCEAIGWRIVREIGPRKYHIAIDFKTAK